MNRFASFPRPLGLVIALGLAACTGDGSYGAGAGGGGGYVGVPASAGNVVPAAVVPGATTPDGGLPTAETYWLQLSSDDSTSMASAQIAKLTAGETRPLGLHRHEVVNYYDPPPGLFDAEAWPLRATPAPTVQLGMEVVLGPEGATPRTAELLLHLEAAPVPTESRRPWNLVYCVDVSGSMTGEKIDFVRDGLLRSLEHLRAGDRVSFVTFETKAQAIFEALRWPEDEARIRRDFAAIVPLGSTNMIEGLNVAYRMAGAHQAPDRLTRVLLFGDGLANVGETDVERFRSLTRNGDQEGLYLTAVGVGYDFDWNMMDRLADAGKGASVFLPNAAETAVVFDTHFPKLVEVAEDEVEIELVLPVGLRLVDFSGEETSTDPNARVPSIILAAGDDLTMLARFEITDASALGQPVEVKIGMRPLATNAPITYQASTSFTALAATPGRFFERTRLVDGYGRIVAHTTPAPTAAELRAAIDAYASPDPGLLEIRGLLPP